MPGCVKGERVTEKPSTGAAKKQPWVKYQKPNVDVALALLPPALFGVYNFGWRALLVILVAQIFGFATEFAFVYRQKKPVTAAVFVTSMLFALIMPPTIPLWIVAVGVVFAVTFGKMVFGGFGQNPFNPAMTGRAFVYISFPVAMTARWSQAADLWPRGLDNYLVDALTGATPLTAGAQGASVPYWQAFFGFTGGSIGETSFLLIALGGAYILYKKYANWRIVVATAGTAIALQTILYLTDNFGLTDHHAVDPLYMILTGGFGLGVFYMATDPVSSASTDTGRWIYGAVIGVATVVIRSFGNFPEGFMFAVLLGNTFAPIIDYTVRERKKAKRAAAALRKGATT